MSIAIRRAKKEDASSMVSLINVIIEKGGTTAFSDPFDSAKMMELFIAPPSMGISCFVAEEESSKNMVGFQGLEWSDPDWPGEDKLPADWAIIATFVADGHQGKGIGGKLFQATLEAAKAAKVSKIDATIKKYNMIGQGYYNKIGFKDYRSSHDSISKRYNLR